MSRSDDYNSEMRNTKFSDQDIELLLSGETPESPEVLQLAPLVEMLRADSLDTPDEASAQRYASEAAEIARASIPNRAPVDLTPAQRVRRPLFRRLAGALAAALLLTGLTGVAVASDDAAPGDSLYGIDRALENVGVGAGGPGERLAEASVLANNGKAADALAHAAEAISQSGNEEAAAALLSAVVQLGNPPVGSGNAADAHARVALMLGCIADAHDNGSDFGQEIANCAAGVDRGQSGQGPQNENNGNGPPDGLPPGPPDGVPPIGLGGPGA